MKVPEKHSSTAWLVKRELGREDIPHIHHGCCLWGIIKQARESKARLFLAFVFRENQRPLQNELCEIVDACAFASTQCSAPFVHPQLTLHRCQPRWFLCTHTYSRNPLALVWLYVVQSLVDPSPATAVCREALQGPSFELCC